MRKLKLLIAACALLLGAGGLYAQTDVTATYIQNAGFDDGETGWTYQTSSGTHYYGTLAYGSGEKINSIAIINSDKFGKSEGKALCTAAGWGTVAYYTQEVTLPAGQYKITFDVFNNRNTTGGTSRLGWVPNGGTPVYSKTEFTYFMWRTHAVNFTLDAETTGQISVGIASVSGSGSGSCAHLYIDNVKIFKMDDTSVKPTIAKPIDYSDLINQSTWSYAEDDGSGSSSSLTTNVNKGEWPYRHAERYRGMGGHYGKKLYQTISDLPAGVYQVKASCMSSHANNVEGSNGLPDGTLNEAYFYANDVETTYPLANATSAFQTNIVTLTEAGNIEFGIKTVAVGANWNAIGCATLVKVANSYDDYIEDLLSESIAQWNTVHDNLAALDATALPDAAENVIKAELAKSRPSTQEGLNESISNMQALIDSYANIKAAYDNVLALISKINEEKEISTGVKTNLESAVSTATNNIETRTTVDELVADYNALESVRETYLLSAQPNSGQSLDYTFLIKNASVISTSDWTNGRTNSGQQYTGAPDNVYLDAWNANFNMYQVIGNLPEGRYLLKVATRADKNLTVGNIYVAQNSANLNQSNIHCDGSSDGELGGGWSWTDVNFTVIDTENDITIGFYSECGNNKWAGADDFRLTYYGNLVTDEDATAILASVVEGKMNAEVAAAQTAAKEAFEAVRTIVNYAALQTAINNASASIAAYTSANDKLAEMKKLTEQTNVYTAEALEAYYTTPKAKYDNNTLTTEEANALVDPNATTGYRSENLAVSQFLISAWDSELNDWAGMHVNTWSAATDFGETGFAVPLVEYWVGSGSLAAKTMTATVSGLEAGNYKVSADMFIKAAALPTGASLQIGDAAAATITGTQNGDFFVSNASSFGTVANDGVLTIKLIVAEGNNFSWIGFKNMKYEKVNVDYANLNAAIAQANAVNAKIAGGVKSLTDAIATAEALLNSFVQSDIDAGVEALNAAITAAETTIIARVNLKGAVKKATALNPFLAESIEADITAASEYAANAEATAAEADSKAAALLANFDSWKKVALTNADFDTDPNILASSISESAVLIYAEKEDPHAYEQTGWTNAMTYGNNASFAKSSVYGSSMAVMNQVAAPATDLFGKNEGATLGLSSGWSNQARFNQTIASLPAGKYVIYYEAYNNYSSQNGINSNYFGVSGLEAGSLEGTNDTFVYDDTKTFPYGEWTVAAKGFQLNKSQSDVKMEIGIIGSTASSNNAAKIWVDNVVIYVLEESAIAEDADYAALNAAIEAAEAKKLGFEKDEFAPYNNIAAQEALVAAKAIDQTTENLKENITALTEAMNSWTANTENVDAIFNGNFAEELKGWKRNSNWGQMQTGLEGDYATAYYNQPGSLVYGETGFYTMPLAANTAYKLTFAYRSHEDNSNNGVTASVLNGEDGLTATSFEKNGSTTDWKTGVKVFKTGAAGNYVLTLANNGNTWMTGVSVVKATLSDVAPELAAVKSEATALLGNAEYANVAGSERTELNTAAATTPEETIDAYLALIDAIKAKMTAFTAAKASYDNFVAEKANAKRIAASITENVSDPTTAAEAVAALQTILVGEYNYVKENYNSNAAETYGMTIDKWIGTATSGGKDDTPQTNSNEKWGDAATTYYEQGKNGWGSSAWTLNYSITKTLPAGEYVLKIAARASEGTTAQLKATVGEETITENLPNVSATGKGITTSGVASFDEGEFANNNNGYGWQWRYLIVKLDEEKEVTFQIDASANSYNQWCSFGDVAIISTVNVSELTAAYNNFEMKTLGFQKDEYAPYQNAELLSAYSQAKAIVEGEAEPDTQEGVDALTATLKAAEWTVNTEDVDAIFNGNFAEELKGWKRTNNWGQVRTGLDGDYATAYYNQPGSLVYGETGVYTMPLAANTAYKLTFAYRSHEDDSNKNVTVSVLNGEDGLAATRLEGNASITEWKTGVKVFKTGAAGNYVLTLANNGNTWMTGVSIVKAEIENITIAENADYTPAETYADVTFKRTVVAGWNGMVLPFDATVAEVKSAFGATAVKDFAGIAYDEAKGVTLKFQDATEVKAGRPFMMKAAAGASYTFNGVVLPATGLQNIEMVDETNSNVKYTMKGTYAATTNLNDVNFALINGNNFFYHTAGVNESSAKAFRAYFENNSTEPASARVSFDFGDDETTGIEEIRQNAAASGQYYDLQGRKVQNLNKKGVYLLNGKKVTVK